MLKVVVGMTDLPASAVLIEVGIFLPIAVALAEAIATISVFAFPGLRNSLSFGSLTVCCLPIYPFFFAPRSGARELFALGSLV